MSKEQLGSLIEQLNAVTKAERLAALTAIRKLVDSGDIPQPARGKDVNNHIHTFYSFSPYSPAKAVYRSWDAGLMTTGIMDHDSISGAEEFIEAGRIMGIATTVGSELRASFAGTLLDGKRVNNPDQNTVTYVAMHGIPHTAIGEVRKFFEPICAARDHRNRAMAARINAILQVPELMIDYDQDVVSISMAQEAGSITERHLLFAVAKKMTQHLGRGQAVLDYLSDKLGIQVGGNARGFLLDVGNDFYDYDLLNVLKAQLVEQFYIPATDEAPPIKVVADFAAQHGIVLAYAYLGDVGDSVTGDKKTQKFEDDFLEDVFTTIKELGFKAVTYMAARNSKKQLDRLRALCVENAMFQISGEDINQPRQKFICEAMRNPEFDNLVDAAWALIGHELSATQDLAQGMFSAETLQRMPSLDERIEYFKNYALQNAVKSKESTDQ